MSDLIPADRFLEPPETHTRDGEERRVGFEMEYSGVEMEAATEAVVEIFGGSPTRVTAFAYEVETDAGAFSVEVDASILKDRAYLDILDGLGIHLPGGTDRLDDLLKRVATTVVPFEIVTPPITLSDIHRVDDLREALRVRGAEGTGASLLYAFGLHLNPEAADLRVDAILGHLRAYVLLADWIRTVAPTDWSRRIVPYIAPYDEPYVEQVLDPAYAPDLDTFVSDYLEANPNRNRALDLLPLLTCAVDDPEALGIPEVGARPAYHYRLPNCRVTDPDWRIAFEWNGWIWMERAAADGSWIERAARERLAAGKDDWAEKAGEWLADL